VETRQVEEAEALALLRDVFGLEVEADEVARALPPVA
jgi:hypothetical protein